MDPNLQSPAGHELPAIPLNNDGAPRAGYAEQSAGPEAALPPSSTQSAPAQAPPTVPPPAVSAQPAQSVAPDPAVAQTGHPGAPAIADDLDLIEKEWVEKAKAIVAQTIHDPYNQNKEMNKFKADYMKKRYNKEIRVEQ